MATHPKSTSPSLNPSTVLDAVCDGDLETLKKLIETHPDCHTVTDSENNNILHLSILLEQYDIFDYLLTLDNIDLNARNGFKLTPFLRALDKESDYFAVELIMKGANVDESFYNNNTYLHVALLHHKFTVAQMLIEKGVDINAQNDDGCTPLHMLFHLKTDPDGVCEGVGMMLYYGADASIVDDTGNIPFELAVLYDPSLITAQENLFFCTFDEYSDYSMSMEVLLELFETRSKLFLEIAEYVSDIVFVKSVYLPPLVLFSIEPECLRVMIKKFDHIIVELFNGPIVSWSDFKPSFLENCEILLNSHLSSETVHFFGKLNIDWIIDTSLNENQISLKQARDVIFYLLTYGIKIHDRNFETIYKNYGYCELFKLLLLMEVEKGYAKSDIVPRIFYDLDMDLEKFLADPHDFSLNAVDTLMDYYARPNLKQFCVSLRVNSLTEKVQSLPEVPLLVEYARDATRKYLVNKYNIQKPRDYFYLVRQLPIGRIHQKILSFERKLYW